jgi:hypothetical protein
MAFHMAAFSRAQVSAHDSDVRGGGRFGIGGMTWRLLIVTA